MKTIANLQTQYKGKKCFPDVPALEPGTQQALKNSNNFYGDRRGQRHYDAMCILTCLGECKPTCKYR